MNSEQNSLNFCMSLNNKNNHINHLVYIFVVQNYDRHNSIENN